MASIKLFFRESTASHSSGALYFRIIHRRKLAILNTGVKIMCDEWSKSESAITGPRSSRLIPIVNAIRSRLENIIVVFENTGHEYSARDILEKYYDNNTIIGIVSFARSIIEEYRQNNKQSSAEDYTTVINNFQSFVGSEDVSFEKIDSRLILSYEAYLKNHGLCQNTTSYYMRKLRSIYNIAVEREMTVQKFPFKNVFTGMAKTQKRAITLDDLRKLKGLELDNSYFDKLARDMFLFSFYTRGMATVDMAFLKKSDLKYGLLTYKRKKTDQQIAIKWEPAMQKIVDKYDDKESAYLLPLIKNSTGDKRRQYLSSSHLLNRHLNRIGKQIGLQQPLTMYVARHTWASIAQENEVPVSVISQGMGHDSETTTRIYLASLDRTKLDNANCSIISLLENK